MRQRRPAAPKKAGPSPRTRVRAPIRFCGTGKHQMPAAWRKQDGCWRCEDDARRLDPAAERDQRKRDLGIGPPPAELTLVETLGGRVHRFRIPPHMRRRSSR